MNQAKIDTSPVKADANLKAAHLEVPKEDVIVKLVIGMRKQCRDWNLAAEHHQKPKERTEGYKLKYKAFLMNVAKAWATVQMVAAEPGSHKDLVQPGPSTPTPQKPHVDPPGRLFECIAEGKKTCRYIVEVGATSHTANYYVNVINKVFETDCCITVETFKMFTGEFVEHDRVGWCPKWIAPNLLTFAGFLFTVLNFLLLSYYDYNFYASSDEHPEFPAVPQWVWAVAALNIFLAYTLDGIDGKQARRTQTTGPLGELFDHGLDSWTAFLIPTCMYSVFGRSMNGIPPLRMYFCLWNIFVNFYLSHWEKHITGVLFLPWGYDASMVPVKTSSIKFFGLLSEPVGDFPFYSFIVGKMFRQKMMFKRAKQMEVTLSKVRAIRRMLEDFPLEILQRLICLAGSMGMHVVMQEHEVAILIFVITSVFGRQVWEFSLPGGISSGHMFELTFYICAMASNIPMSLWNIYKSYRDRTGKMRPFSEAVKPLVPVTLFLIVCTVWVVYSPVDIVNLDPRCVYLVTGTIFSNICCRLIVSQMSSVHCDLFNWLIIPVGLVTAVSLMLPSTTGASAELSMLYALAVITTVAHVHYGTCVVCASYINIYAIKCQNLKLDTILRQVRPVVSLISSLCPLSSYLVCRVAAF
ncbi:hypothetical protein B7P43_G07517 [Cryptotermes secundus]|uniref:Ethanolaminephosphotransferase 1 n=1 Tax=Cryptotermes secundus TaxID=105785 RepID=A0A2J7PSH9_9NEOP|nr:hypothetical protein B7P43_G07517 [Cryptotermes secundus]